MSLVGARLESCWPAERLSPDRAGQALGFEELTFPLAAAKQRLRLLQRCAAEGWVALAGA
jgi:hypothetical protein